MKKVLFILLSVTLLAAGKSDNLSYIRQIEKSLACVPPSTFFYPPAGITPPTPLFSHTGAVPQKTDSFYMYKYEVSNGQYLRYVNDLLAQGKKEEYKDALPDTTVWQKSYAHFKPYTYTYFRHPAYADYPVVGVSYAQAEHFCEWLTEKYMKAEKRRFSKVKFMLPTVLQWYTAALGGQSAAMFPWNGPYARRTTGEFKANFQRVFDQCIYRDSLTQELKVDLSLGYANDDTHYGSTIADVTAPVVSYWPNDYDIYNMAGNVEEFVREKGITKGGSWRDPAYYLLNWVEEKYNPDSSASAERGFRFAMEIVK